MSVSIRISFGLLSVLVAGLLPGASLAGGLPPDPGVPAATLRSGEVPVAGMAPATVGTTTSDGARVAPQHARPYGRSYGEWVVAWWRWAIKTRAAANPLLDPQSSNCGAGDQPARVRFLGGTFTGGADDPPVVRHCTVPVGTAFFFPVLNAVWASTPEPRTGCPIAADPWYGSRPGDPEYRQFLRDIYRPVGVDPDNPGSSLALFVDGKRVAGVADWYLRSPAFFDALLPDDNVFDALVGVDCYGRIRLTPNVGYGYHAFLYPLPQGRHTIRWTADAVLPFLGTLHQDVTYHVTVRAGR
jgi:hypothetical protein